MLEIVWVRIDGAEKVSVIYHSEQESFRYASNDRLIYRQ